MAFTLTSDAFGTGGRIPRANTCDGEDTRPALSWTDPPEGTRSYLLLVQDPDAPRGTFLHYSAWGLAGELRELPAGVRAPAEGRTGFGTVGWRGPCPPPGPEHHYVFRLLALDRPIEADPGAGLDEIEPQIPERMLGEAELVGLYARA